MPLVKSSNLPTYDRLIAENRPILPKGRAITQDIRELHIGFLNMMPDAAMEATERQWFRLIGESNRVAQIYIHPFNIPVVPRGEKAQRHIDEFYENFEDLKKAGLDALIITGANEETNPHVSDLSNWAPLKEVIDWAHASVASTIFACFASHFLMTHYHGQEPEWRKEKRLGVFPHRVLNRTHPLVSAMNTKHDVIYSRYSEISRAQFDQAGLQTLVESKEAGVHMAVSKDGFRQICFQGHPEYDMLSLLKEYKRDVAWFQDGTVKDFPTPPLHYFEEGAQEILDDLKNKIIAGEAVKFPEDELMNFIENTWADSARSIISGWIGHVYQVTNVERHKQFMDGVDPDNPLGI